MIGSGTPNSQNNAPRPKPIVASLCCSESNSAQCFMFPTTRLSRLGKKMGRRGRPTRMQH